MAWIAERRRSQPGRLPADYDVVRWALEHYLGVAEEAREPEPYDAGRAQQIVGEYENDAMTFTITDADENLTIEVLIRPEIRATSEVELPPSQFFVSSSSVR